MSNHDPLNVITMAAAAELIRQARADERERIKALCRMLLDSGDITPMAVRVLTKGGDDEG